jgi:phage terminase large subunit GpA-like protein
MLRYSHGKPYYIYEAGNRRNEPLDIRVYALAAHRRLAFDAVKLREEYKVTGDVTPVTPDVTPAPKTNWKDAMEPAQIATVPAAPTTEQAMQKPVAPPAPVRVYVPLSQRMNGGGQGAPMFGR